MALGFRKVRTAVLVLGIMGTLFGGQKSCFARGKRFEGYQVTEQKGYFVGIKTSLEKVFKEPKKLKGKIEERAIVKAARNEYESFQIILFSKRGDLKNVKVEPTHLICYDQKGVIQKENISCYQVGYVKTKKPAYHVDYVGWWPDPLLPLNEFDVEEGVVQPIWVTIYVPEDAAPGKYHGTIRVIPENAEAETVEVSLTVWDFDLPNESSLQVVFSLSEHYLRDFYKFDTVPLELRRQYYSFLLAHRINPTCLYLYSGPLPRLEDLEFCIDRGMNAINIAYLFDWKQNAGDRGFFSKQFKHNLELTLSKTVIFLQEYQWSDKAFVYGIDEPNPEYYDTIKEMFSLVGRVAPGIRRVLSEPPTEELFGYVDVWVPRIDDYDKEICSRRQEMGEEIWWYVSCAPRHPYPNFFIDYPAIDHRILFWMTWKYNISGFLYYSLNRWLSNYSQNQKKWPEIPWNTFTWRNFNGDGQLIYPGLTGEPYSSVRLEVIRDGIEDYEYLRILQTRISDLVGREFKSKKPTLCSAKDLLFDIQTKIAEDLTHYTKNPNQMLMYRERVAKEILKINRFMEQCSKGLESMN